jgi:glycosyltransferase involved in cell wall biosynthesis
MEMYPKITAIMCTYRRFAFVERALNMFVNQDYVGKTQLIIYNTDVESPYILNQELINSIGDKNIELKFINNNTDQVTGMPYTNVGAIRRDALEHATGEYVMTYDDDDIYLPWFFRQSLNRIRETGRPFFKPMYSFWRGGADAVELVRNTMEASVMGDINKVREYGYDLHTGKEGLSWYTKARDNGELNEDDDYCIPQYCFDWQTNPTTAFYVHRQSGNIDALDNFDNHKEASLDRVNNRKLVLYDKVKMYEIYKPYYDYLIANKNRFNAALLRRYFDYIFE